MPKHQPLPLFRTMCIVGMALLLISVVCNLVDMFPTITSLMFMAGATLVVIGIVGWLITGYGI